MFQLRSTVLAIWSDKLPEPWEWVVVRVATEVGAVHRHGVT